jgi:proline iminopeptidase
VPLHPETEPFAHGMLDVGGDEIYWETCGTPSGKPALVLHGGPGSGCGPWHRRLFDPARYRVVLFDQRNCGRSRPHASAPQIDLSANTTANLIADIEKLRMHLGVQRWLVLGGSWGSGLALAYAERFPDRVTELVLFGVTTGRREEFDWLFRDGLARVFPEAWELRREAWLGDGRVVRDIYRLANTPAVLINGRYDLQAPLATAWELHRLWPRSELVVIDGAGHSASDSRLTDAIVAATDAFAKA